MDNPRRSNATIKIFGYMVFSFVIANVAGMMAFVPFVFVLNAGHFSNLMGAIVFISGVILYLIVLIYCYKRLYHQFLKNGINES